MGKKNKPNRHVLKARKGLTLDRLATTVRADDPTVILGNGPLSLGKRFATGISQVAQRFVPAKIRRGPAAAAALAQDKKANRRLRKIAKQIAQGKPVQPKPRRSRLPLVIVAVLAMLVSGGYWTFHNVPWPDASGVAKVLDYNRWFDSVSGQAKPGETRTVKSSHGKSKRRFVNGARNSRKSSVSRQGSRKVTKSSSAKRKGRITAAQKRAWKQKLAKLKQKSQQRYKKASRRYRRGDR